jgi:hypothetical protein
MFFWLNKISVKKWVCWLPSLAVCFPLGAPLASISNVCVCVWGRGEGCWTAICTPDLSTNIALKKVTPRLPETNDGRRANCIDALLSIVSWGVGNCIDILTLFVFSTDPNILLHERLRINQRNRRCERTVKKTSHLSSLL